MTAQVENEKTLAVFSSTPRLLFDGYGDLLPELTEFKLNLRNFGFDMINPKIVDLPDGIVAAAYPPACIPHEELNVGNRWACSIKFAGAGVEAVKSGFTIEYEGPFGKRRKFIAGDIVGKRFIDTNDDRWPAGS